MIFVFQRSGMLLKFLTVVAVCIAHSMAISINNTLLGTPHVTCGPDALEVWGNTAAPFDGVMYIKNWRRNPACFQSFVTNSTTRPGLRIGLNEIGNCGMEIIRQPGTREVEIIGVWVFSFHQRFVTKVDRAFAIHCIFQQKQVTVTTGFNVGALTTRDTLSGAAQSPAVSLKIYTEYGNGDQSLVEADKVQVGDPITFVFSIQPSGLYGLMVKDCFVETLKGQRVKIMHEGCTLDDTAMSAVVPKADFTEAVAFSHAFKFADAEDVWFKCTVTLCNRLGGVLASDDGACEKKVCRSRSKREAIQEMTDPSKLRITINDNVAQKRLTVLDRYNQGVGDVSTWIPQSARNSSETRDKKRIVLYEPSTQPKRVQKSSFCMRKPVFALVTSILVVMYTAIFLLGSIAVVLHFKKDSIDVREYFRNYRF